MSLMGLTRSGAKKARRHVSDESFPQQLLLEIFQRCDPVTVSRCMMVCSRWRSLLQSERSRSNPIRIATAHARLFICDRRRAIVERFVDEGCEGGSPGPSPGQSRPSPGQSRPSTYSSSNSITAYDSNESAEKAPVRVRQLITPRQTCFEKEQYANISESSWAFKFDLWEWAGEYEVDEVCLQNFCSFLERDHDRTAMAEPSQSSSIYNSDAHRNMPTPPWSGNASPEGSSSLGSSAPSKYHSLPSSKNIEKKPSIVQLTDELCGELSLLSAGRLERLADRLKAVSPLHIIFRDHFHYTKRPAALLFWFLNIVRPSLRRVTLDSIQGDDSLRLEGVLPMDGLDYLHVKQPAKTAAIIVNEEILLSWLRVPAASRRRLRARFHGCRRFSAHGMMRFIRRWQSSSEVAMFEHIIIDEDTMHPWELVHEAEHPKDDSAWDEEFVRETVCLPAYLSSAKEARSDEERECCRRSLSFPHKKHPSMSIHYSYEDGCLIFRCLRSTSLSSPPLTPHGSAHRLSRPPSIRRINSLGRNSLPRDAALPPAYARDLHAFAPPESPSVLGRLIQLVLRSNA